MSTSDIQIPAFIQPGTKVFVRAGNNTVTRGEVLYTDIHTRIRSLQAEIAVTYYIGTIGIVDADKVFSTPEEAFA